MLKILNLGAGVQSSTLALMYVTGFLPEPPDAAIFADTGSESRATYAWLDFLEQQLTFPLHRVRRGDLRTESLQTRVSPKSGKTFIRALLPFYLKNPDGTTGILNRRCTYDFKVDPIEKKIREILGVKRGRKYLMARSILGISTDEASRMRDSGKKWIRLEYPLIDLGFSRYDCQRWISKTGFPQPPRSSCTFCPFHSLREWKALRDGSPEEFEDAANYEDQVREAFRSKQTSLNSEPFLTKMRRPLREIPWDSIETVPEANAMLNECSGACGV